MMTSVPSPVIQFKDVEFSYHQQTVLEDINFSIAKGEFVGIIGPNGSGKTTLLRLLLGLLQPEKGQVLLFNTPVVTGKNTAQLGYMPQKITQLETRFPITVGEVVQLGRVHTKTFFPFPSKEDANAVEMALKTAGLLKYRHRLITELSGGQQQRVFIAKALATQPKVLILDEPTVGVDAESQEQFYKLLTKLNKEMGITIVLVSHDIDVVMSEVQTILCLNKTLIYHGSSHHFIKGNYMEKLYGKGQKLVVHGH
jgi:zinc transport system ATP-binding protein